MEVSVYLYSFRYLCLSAHQIFIRRSKPVKQLISRMNQMIENSIKEYPGDRATLTEFFNSIRCMFVEQIDSFIFLHLHFF